MNTKHSYINHIPLWKKIGIATATTALVLSMLPATVFAEGTDDTTNSSVEASQQADGNSGSSSSSDNGAPTAPPDSNGGSGSGQAPSGNPPDGSGQAPDGAGSGQAPDANGGGAGGGANTQSFDYSGSYSATATADGQDETSDSETIAATDADQNAVLAQNGGTYTITNATITKSGDDTDNADNTNFYGTNSGVLAVGEGSTIYLSESSVETSSAGSNAIFATDSGTVYANDVSINTTSTDGNSRGLDATYDGTIIANNMNISTLGNHCATLATDRGGGNVSVTNSTLSTAGSGSPLLYSTGDIEVENVTGTASGSQIAGMEGYNSIYISNSTLESTNNATTGSDPIKNGVIIYQSQSGDADTSTGQTATFEAADSTLKTNIDSGAMFYLTNTTANVVLSNTTLDFDSDNVNLIEAEGNDSNSWGSAGSNGATVTFTLSGETVSGNVVADDISTVDLYLTDGTTWTGSSAINENSASNKTTSDAPITINVDSDSTWTVTENCTLTNLNVASGGQVVDSDGNTVTIVAGGSTVVEGTSDITVTVTGSYTTEVSTSQTNTITGASIDRSAFDTHYGITTQMASYSAENTSTNSDSTDVSTDSTGSSSTDDSSSTGNFLLDWFNSIIAFFTGQ